jgi:hypothetical protein
MSMERSAAELQRRSLHLASICEENIGGIPIDVGKNEILDTPGQHSNTESYAPVGRPFNRADELMRKMTLDRWSLGFQASNLGW